MNTVDLRTGARPAGALQHACQAGRAPDYHALGTFSETWSFLEYFLERCVQVGGGEAAYDQPLSPRLDALERLGGEAAALAAEVRALAHRRQAALQDLARASLSRMGLGQLDVSAAPQPAAGDKALDALHMRTCDLVRRAVLLLCALEKARA
ncbi:hypothetical protein [Phenylobacterium sp. 58.2.17]|uniref:hypothetical protein n=1 Tax=Phenylobacterium sp. 58.2.17 TaxID=2969306 RepID=UPI002264D5B3|nr:hypothetical protein [Phenylobacterium sp. 58.2.17]MCX7587157.1 hypothetical protein [Phenylobacterium sp. 58.2.17]